MIRWMFTILILVTGLMGCRKSHTCYAENDLGVIKDTLLCDCYPSNVRQLEQGSVQKDGETLTVKCFED